MDDILASIRRILDEDQGAKPPEGDVLVLDPSMMVDEPAAAEPGRASGSEAAPRAAPMAAPLAAMTETDHNGAVNNDALSPAPTIAREAPAGAPMPMAGTSSMTTMVAPEAAAAAAQSVGTLMRTLAAERSTAVSRGGVTIEDLVREEIRPLLKAWLDEHLPPVVERAVRAEIERVVGRQTG